MKKQLFALIFALAMAVVINVGEAHAQNSLTIRVDVPFAFTANDKTLPAGMYRVSPATDSRKAWKIDGEDRGLGGRAFLLAKTLSSGQRSEPLQLTFRRYRDMYFLVAFNTPSYRVDLPTSKGEKALRKGGNMIAKKTVAAMDTMQKGSH
jgi:hypothetical protein